jgi:hypothetical protein
MKRLHGDIGAVPVNDFDAGRVNGATGGWESPSLTAGDPGVAAYELKFLLTEPQAAAVADLAAAHLAPDPHADPQRGGAYRTTSVYCDTARLDVFHRVGSFGRRKHRLRRYGRETWVFLERKTRRGDRVAKLRSRVGGNELAGLAGPATAYDWPGHWFHEAVRRRGLGPVCRIAYDRLAYAGWLDGAPARLTLDRDVRGETCSSWDVADLDGGTAVLSGRVVCEFKYRSTLPHFFKDVMTRLRLAPSPVSKYRHFMQSRGLADCREAARA